MNVRCAQLRAFNESLSSPGPPVGVLVVYMTGGGGGGADRDSYCEPKKIREPEILHPKKIPGIKIFYPKKCKTKYLNAALFNQQTLGPQKIRDISLDPKQIPRV